jgi:hypothetical protein
MSKQSSSPVSRRTALAGAGTAGALAAAAALLPMGKPAADAAVAARPQTDAEPTGGYQLTEHVKRYYRTARV